MIVFYLSCRYNPASSVLCTAVMAATAPVFPVRRVASIAFSYLAILLLRMLQVGHFGQLPWLPWRLLSLSMNYVESGRPCCWKMVFVVFVVTSAVSC